MKKTIIAIAILSTLGVNTFLIENESSQEKEILPEVTQVEKTLEVTTISKEKPLSKRTQDDIYAMKSEDGTIGYMPLKAKKASYNGIEYFYLQDGQGSFYISFDNLIDGQNYIGFVGKNDDKLYTYMKDDFKFDYEDWFHEKENIREDNSVAEKLMKNTMIEL